YGKIYYTGGAARGVLTGINPGSGGRLTQQNAPRITSASVSVDYSGFGACVLKIQGAGFPAGSSVTLAANHPPGRYYFNAGPTVASDGTFTYANQSSCTPTFRKINGYGTLEAQAGGKVAITAVSSYAGTTYTGDM